MKFDVVIGNPPYNNQRRRQPGIWKYFWRLAFENGRHLCLLTPTGWLSPYVQWGGIRLWDRFDSAQSELFVVDHDVFPGIGHGDIGYVVVDTAGSTGLQLPMPYSKTLKVAPRGSVDEVEAALVEPPYLRGARAMAGCCRVIVSVTKTVREETVLVLAADDAQPAGWWFGLECRDKEHAVSVRQTLLQKRDLLNKHLRWSGWLTDKYVARLAK